MNAYLFSNIQSAAYGNFFECSTHEENGCDIVFSSMSHENEVGVMDDGEELLLTSLLNTEGLKTRFSSLATEDGIVLRQPKNDLTNHLALLGEIFHVAATLPHDAEAVLPERTVRIATVREKYLQYHRRNVFQLSKAREVLEFIDSLSNIPCERHISDIVNDQFCEPPRVSVDEDDNRVEFSPAEFNETEFESAIDACDELFGSNGAIWWEASALGIKLQKVDARGDWNVVEPGILEKVPAELEPDEEDSREVCFHDETTSFTGRAVELMFEEIMDGETSSAIDLRDVRSHDDDDEETLSQLSELGFDGFYELDGEYFGWHKESPPPYEDFSESDLLTVAKLAEKLVSDYE